MGDFKKTNTAIKERAAHLPKGAMPPNPNKAAIKAMTKNTTA